MVHGLGQDDSEMPAKQAFQVRGALGVQPLLQLPPVGRPHAEPALQQRRIQAQLQCFLPGLLADLPAQLLQHQAHGLAPPNPFAFEFTAPRQPAEPGLLQG
ncbi:MAG: hypothetical protein EBZ48_15940, partial [Proteobacteria bacterium]|nr:hypothetical protein [Pseudomonadota bacterium]